MKLDARRIEAFLADPGRCRAVLLHGDDAGLIGERAGLLVRAVIGAADDPFRAVELGRDDHGRVPEEMAALSLIGGRRVVRLREANDTVTRSVTAALQGKGDALLVIEAPGLTARATLRRVVENAADGVAIGCYAEEGRTLEASIRAALAQRGVSVEPEALTWLATQLGADRAVTQREVEKLALYAGEAGRVGLEDARRSVGDLAGLSLDDALDAACAGDIGGADRALELAMAEGASPVGVLRAGLIHLQRLQRVSGAIAEGASPEEAIKALRPPLFFKRHSSFKAALRLWSAEGLLAAGTRLWEAERACKRTHAPDEAISRSAILGIAQRAAARRRGAA